LVYVYSNFKKKAILIFLTVQTNSSFTKTAPKVEESVSMRKMVEKQTSLHATADNVS
jgi:hypothetical protein